MRNIQALERTSNNDTQCISMGDMARMSRVKFNNDSDDMFGGKHKSSDEGIGGDGGLGADRFTPLHEGKGNARPNIFGNNTNTNTKKVRTRGLRRNRSHGLSGQELFDLANPVTSPFIPVPMEGK